MHKSFREASFNYTWALLFLTSQRYARSTTCLESQILPNCLSSILFHSLQLLGQCLRTKLWRFTWIGACWSFRVHFLPTCHTYLISCAHHTITTDHCSNHSRWHFFFCIHELWKKDAGMNQILIHLQLLPEHYRHYHVF